MKIVKIVKNSDYNPPIDCNKLINPDVILNIDPSLTLSNPNLSKDDLKRWIAMDPDIYTIAMCYKHPNCDEELKSAIESDFKGDFAWFLKNCMKYVRLDKFVLGRLKFMATNFPMVFQDKEVFELFKQYLYVLYKMNKDVISALNALDTYPWIQNDFFVSALKRKLEQA